MKAFPVSYSKVYTVLFMFAFPDPRETKFLFKFVVTTLFQYSSIGVLTKKKKKHLISQIATFLYIYLHTLK